MAWRRWALILVIGRKSGSVSSPPVYASALAVMLFCLEIFGVLDAVIPYVYFQF